MVGAAARQRRTSQSVWGRPLPRIYPPTADAHWHLEATLAHAARVEPARNTGPRHSAKSVEHIWARRRAKKDQRECLGAPAPTHLPSDCGRALAPLGTACTCSQGGDCPKDRSLPFIRDKKAWLGPPPGKEGPARASGGARSNASTLRLRTRTRTLRHACTRSQGRACRKKRYLPFI